MCQAVDTTQNADAAATVCSSEPSGISSRAGTRTSSPYAPQYRCRSSCSWGSGPPPAHAFGAGPGRVLMLYGDGLADGPPGHVRAQRGDDARELSAQHVRHHELPRRRPRARIEIDVVEAAGIGLRRASSGPGTGKRSASAVRGDRRTQRSEPGTGCVRHLRLRWHPLRAPRPANCIAV